MRKTLVVEFRDSEAKLYYALACKNVSSGYFLVSTVRGLNMSLIIARFEAVTPSL